MTLVIIAIIAGVLFGLGFLSKRRFGVLGLGLTAGVLLSQSLSSQVAAVLSTYAVPVAPLSPSTAAIIAMTLAPSLLLIIGGPRYADRKLAVIGALLFALLGTLLILGPLTVDLPADGATIKLVMDFIARWQDIIVAAGVALAVLDLMLVHGMKHGSGKRPKH